MVLAVVARSSISVELGLAKATPEGFGSQQLANGFPAAAPPHDAAVQDRVRRGEGVVTGPGAGACLRRQRRGKS